MGGEVHRFLLTVYLPSLLFLRSVDSLLLPKRLVASLFHLYEQNLVSLWFATAAISQIYLIPPSIFFYLRFPCILFAELFRASLFGVYG